MVSLRAVLKSIYYDPSHPASYGGIQALYRAVQKDGRVRPNVKAIQSWLEEQDTYTLHKQPKRRFTRNRVIVSGIDQQWQIDLADLSNLSRYNKGYKFLLVCIDILSKFAWVVPIKDKKSDTVVQAFKKILATNRKPKKVQSDKGTEFLNRHFQKLLKDEGIHFFTTGNETKASVVERLNRTLKGKMYRFFTHKSTLKYVDILPQLVSSYNNTYHRSIKRAPSTVNATNEQDVWRTLYGTVDDKSPIQFKFEVGDRVRVSKNKLQFEKGYLPNFSDEIFTIHKRYNRRPPVYSLRDFHDEIIEGTFYEAELQKVLKPEDALYRIEKVLRKRKRNGKTQYLVRWQGYSKQFDSWIDDIKDIAEAD